MIAIGSCTAIGFICAAVLAVASKVMAVTVDERMALIRECLPGVNCGVCGFSGCDGYATALIEDDADTVLCIPGGDEASTQISLILGKTPGGDVAKSSAIVHCVGDFDTNRVMIEYNGIRTCAAAKQLYGWQGSCTFGCIGFGDCADVCPNEAICIENGLAHIDLRRCIGCGLCVNSCPNGVISIEYSAIVVAVKCKNIEKGALMKDKCARGCIGCTRCAKECPSGAITVSDSLAKIDYTKCTGCGMCAGSCARGCIA